MNETPTSPTEQPALPPILPTDPVVSRYKGVGGWLLLFCIGLTILSPLLTLVSLGTAISQVLPLFQQFPGLMIITIIDTLLSASLMVFSIYTGIGLWRLRPKAVQTARIYLFTFLGYQVVASILPFLAGLPSAANEAMIAQIAQDVTRGLIYFAIWFSYLNKSVRVKATYQS